MYTVELSILLLSFQNRGAYDIETILQEKKIKMG